MKLTIETTYNRGAKVARNGNDLTAKHMSKSAPCPDCGGPKSYRADLCRACASDYRELGPWSYGQRQSLRARTGR